MVFCLAMACELSAPAAQMDVAIDAEAKIVSSFVWRGRTLNNDPCFQPSFSAGMGNFSANIWGSWNLTSEDNAWQSSRVDATFDYTFTYASHIIRPGFTAFIYHDDPAGRAKDTYECFVNYTYDVFLLPSIVLYYDFSKIDGYFVTASIAHSYPIVKDRVALDLKLQLDAADRNFNNALFSYPASRAGDPDKVPDKGGLVDTALSASLPVTLGKNSVLTPAIRVIILLDSTIWDLANGVNEDTTAYVYSLAFNMWF